MQQIRSYRLSEVENYLNKQVRGDDNVKNLNAIKDLLRDNSATQIYSSEQLEEFQNFLELDKVLGDSECSSSSFEILEKFNRKAVSTGQLNKTNRIIRNIGKQHSKRCTGVAEALANRSLNSMSKAIVSHVQSFTDATIRVIKAQNPFLSPHRMDENELILYLVKEPVESVWQGQLGSDTYPTEVLKTLLAMIRGTTDDVESPKVLDENKLKGIYKDWIVTSCQKYIESLSDFYKMWYKISHWIPVDVFDYTEVNFTYYRFQICSQLVRKDEEKLATAMSEVLDKWKKSM